MLFLLLSLLSTLGLAGRNIAKSPPIPPVRRHVKPPRLSEVVQQNEFRLPEVVQHNRVLRDENEILRFENKKLREAVSLPGRIHITGTPQTVLERARTISPLNDGIRSKDESKDQQIADLNKQVADLKETIQLKDKQMAELQAHYALATKRANRKRKRAHRKAQEQYELEIERANREAKAHREAQELYERSRCQVEQYEQKVLIESIPEACARAIAETYARLTTQRTRGNGKRGSAFCCGVFGTGK